MNFSTTITDKYIDIINCDADDKTPSDFLISFVIEIEQKEWGIKNISVYSITVLSGSITLTDEEGVETEIDCTDFAVHEEVEVNSGCITVRELEIDVNNKIIKVR